MKLTIRFLIFVIYIVAHVTPACGEETYYIDNSPLLLYKTINWWYDSLPEESYLLCGKPIKCINKGNARVEYDVAKKRFGIHIEGGLASMLSVVKKCRQCYGPSRLYCLSFNRDYFSDGEATIMTGASSTVDSFIFKNITKKQAQVMISLEKDLVFMVEGVIGGLYNDQIALHESGDLLKNCRGPFLGKYNKYPICIKIIYAKSHEVLAEYTMEWE